MSDDYPKEDVPVNDDAIIEHGDDVFELRTIDVPVQPAEPKPENPGALNA
jgi:hypothetical protein